MHDHIFSFHIDIKAYLNDASDHFIPLIQPILDEYYIIKVAACLCAIFEKVVISDEGEKKETQKLYIHTKAEVIDFETDLSKHFEEYVTLFILKKIDDREMQGSGFTLSEIIELNIQVSSFEPYEGSSYIELPKALKSKKAVINFQNTDNKCLMYSVLAALYPADKDPQRVTKYIPYRNALNFDDIRFPVDLKEIMKFEKQNPSISINVYIYDQNKKIRSLRLAKEVKQKHIHLLLLTESTNERSEMFKKSHYCWIKNLSALIGKQVTAHGCKLYICDRCLNHFSNENKMKEHRIACFKQNECQIVMPHFFNNIVEFKNHNRQMKVPFIIYADIESIPKKPEKTFCESKSTVAYQEHEIYNIGFYFKAYTMTRNHFIEVNEV